MTMRVVVVMVMVAGMVAILVMMMTAPSVYLEHCFSTLTAR